MSCCMPSNRQNESECTSTAGEVKIHRDMTIEEMLRLFPHKASKLAQLIKGAGLHCMDCGYAGMETLASGMSSHGKSDAEIEQLIAELNALLLEKGETGTVYFTERGAAKFLEILAKENKKGWGIRLSEVAAGCRGYKPSLSFSEKAEDEDEVFHSQGLEIHVNKKLLDNLLGSEIDYVEGLQGAGFKVSNPNVRSSCGCGSSYGY